MHLDIILLDCIIKCVPVKINNLKPQQMLDLSNPATFRDLSKPMGAQTEKRKQMFIQRYEEVENNEGEGVRSIFVCFNVIFYNIYIFFILPCFCPNIFIAL